MRDILWGLLTFGEIDHWPFKVGEWTVGDGGGRSGEMMAAAYD